MPTVSDYLNLIPAANKAKPKFTAMVSAVAGAFADCTASLAAIEAGFNLDTAIGAQLDVIGLWIGLPRKISTPLAVYFSFDNAALGFDLGSWQGPFDPSQGLTTLDDATYRTMLRAKIAANNWDGTLDSFQSIVVSIFTGSGALPFAVDNQDMSMDVYIAGVTPPPVLLALLKNGYLPLKPEGVHINGYTTSSVSGTPLFGFDMSNSYVSGFDTGSWGTPV